ncbi:MAG: EAL domain-containing protein [Pseudomonadota bacterium]|nr:EAL domain-containing protein [Pseudomonadota bacterium]
MSENSEIRILYVDDYEPDRVLVRDALERSGEPFTLIEATGKSDFESCLDQGGFELVLSDFNILGFEGLEVLQAVQEHHPDVPVIIVTGTGSEEVAVAAMKRGAADYLIKTPEQIRRLPHLIRTAIIHREAQRARDRLVAICEVTSDIVGTARPDGRLTYMNTAGKRFFGLTDSQIQNRNVSALHPRWALDLIMNDGIPMAMLEGVWHGETAIIEASGEEVAVSQVIIAHKDARGRVPFLSTVLRDIRERARVEKALKESEARYRLISQQTGQLIYDYNLEKDTVEWTGAPEQVVGYSAGALADIDMQRWSEWIHPDEREWVRRRFAAAVEHGTDYHADYRLRHKDGEYRFVSANGVILKDESGRPKRMLGTVNDVTSRQQSEQELRLAAQAMENTAEAIIITDADYRVVRINQAYTEITGFTLDEVHHQHPPHLEVAWRNRVAEDSIAPSDGWQTEIHCRRKTGEYFHGLVSVSTVRDDIDSDIHHVIVLSDVSRIRDYEQRLEFLVNRDALTHLPNRSLLTSRFEEAIGEASADGSVVALLLLDLDRFKTINESLGHHAGDHLLKEVAERLLVCVPQAATVARLGGDEFAVILPDLERPSDATEIVNQLLRATSEPFEHLSHRIFTTVSVGVSCYPHDGRDLSSLLKHADAALYQAKAKGKNTFQFFSEEMNTKAVRTLVLQNNLHQAMERNEFELDYQPTVDMRSGEITGVEALIRWRHPELGRIPPGDFIPLAEETGIIVPVGEWVLRTACQQAKTWEKISGQPIHMAVNLSARQFNQSDLIERIQSILAESDLDPALLRLEVTESMVMPDPVGARRILSDIHDLGILIAIDDFGMGYSSLSYLKQFPIDYLKVDRSFVTGIPDDLDDVAITNAVIAMAHSLNLRVIAEGVETSEQREHLTDWQCEEGQGYYFSKPVSPDEIDRMLAERVLPVAMQA